MNYPKFIIIHCSDSKTGSAKEIDEWHKERGFKKIGYHYVICNGYENKDSRYNKALDGYTDKGRAEKEIGAHCLKMNDKSIGICLVGTNKFSQFQFDTLYDLCYMLSIKYAIPISNIIGHQETESGKQHGKTCPNFNVEIVRAVVQKKHLENKFK